MIDPFNTLRSEGASCAVCGDDASGIDTINNLPVATCSECRHDHTEKCGQCDRRCWQQSMTRIHSDLWCADCASGHPAIVGDVMAGIRADEQQDSFNRLRR